MIVKHFSEVEGTTFVGEDSQGVVIRPMISGADGAPTFAMRYFEIAVGGYTPLHSHAWEHEIFILSGRASVTGPDGSRMLEPGTAVFIPPDEEHQFRNEGDAPLIMTCSIPLQDQ